MDLFLKCYWGIDTLLITPYRWPTNPYIGWWLGTFLIALWCCALGRLSTAAALKVNRRLIIETFGETSDRHDQSMAALRAGDRKAFKAINQLANEAYGKAFFLQIATAAAYLWPLPLALTWLDLRFATIRFQLPVTLPGIGREVGYPFAFILLYVLARCLLRGLKSTRLGLRTQRSRQPGGGGPPPAKPDPGCRAMGDL